MQILNKLQRSKFRSSFSLDEKSKKYVEEKGPEVIRKHAFDFVNNRLKKTPANDGKQTPWRGHPVFIAQHATATCCRKCISKWHKIPKTKILGPEDKKYLVDVIMAWIGSQMKF